MKNFSNITLEDLYDAVACYNSDPFLVEYEEQAQELFDFIKSSECKLIEDEDDFEIAKERLDLEGYDVKAIYDCGLLNQVHATICLKEDFE